MLKDGCYFRILVRKEDKIVGEPKKSILMSVLKTLRKLCWLSGTRSINLSLLSMQKKAR